MDTETRLKVVEERVEAHASQIGNCLGLINHIFTDYTFPKKPGKVPRDCGVCLVNSVCSQTVKYGDERCLTVNGKLSNI